MDIDINFQEKQWFLQVADGDEGAFKLLFEHYGKLLYPFLFRTVKSQVHAEELIQEVMLKVWLYRDRLPEVDSPRKWIFRVAANLAYSALRRQGVEGKFLKQLKVQLPSPEDPQDMHSLAELKSHVQAAIRQLSPERKRIYLLSREAGLSRDEIAAQLGISPKTVKNTISRALQYIRDYLEQMGYLLPMIYILLINL